MKIRNGFVSNSSSTSFIIKNITNRSINFIEFIKENEYLISGFIEYYDDEVNEKDLKDSILKEAEKMNVVFKPKEKKIMIFGDEQGTDIGRVYDYMLRDGGKSDSFYWELEEYLR